MLFPKHAFSARHLCARETQSLGDHAGADGVTDVHNVSHEVKGDKLIITVDIGKSTIQAAPPSSSGKTYLVGTTGGALPVACPHGSVTFAINVMAKKG